MVIPEAMALGTPCVATDMTGIPEVIRHEQTGLIVPERSPAALADAVDQLLVDQSLRVQVARQARKLIETEFDVHTNIDHVRECFNLSRQLTQTNSKTSFESVL